MACRWQARLPAHLSRVSRREAMRARASPGKSSKPGQGPPHSEPPSAMFRQGGSLWVVWRRVVRRRREHGYQEHGYQKSRLRHPYTSSTRGTAIPRSQRSPSPSPTLLALLVQLVVCQVFLDAVLHTQSFGSSRTGTHQRGGMATPSSRGARPGQASHAQHDSLQRPHLLEQAVYLRPPPIKLLLQPALHAAARARAGGWVQVPGPTSGAPPPTAGGSELSSHRQQPPHPASHPQRIYVVYPAIGRVARQLGGLLCSTAARGTAAGVERQRPYDACTQAALPGKYHARPHSPPPPLCVLHATLTEGVISVGVVARVLSQLLPLRRHLRLQRRQLRRQLLPLVLHPSPWEAGWPVTGRSEQRLSLACSTVEGRWVLEERRAGRRAAQGMAAAYAVILARPALLRLLLQRSALRSLVLQQPAKPGPGQLGLPKIKTHTSPSYAAPPPRRHLPIAHAHRPPPSPQPEPHPERCLCRRHLAVQDDGGLAWEGPEIVADAYLLAVHQVVIHQALQAASGWAVGGGGGWLVAVAGWWR